MFRPGGSSFCQILCLAALLGVAAHTTDAAAPQSGDLRVCPEPESAPTACSFASLQAALAQARPGQTILVAPGTYREGVKIAVPGVTIRGEPGAHFTERVYNGKGIFTVTAPDVTIEGIEFSKASARDGNGAAIRLETPRATIRGNRFRDNQMHILGGTAGTPSRIVIEDNRMTGTVPSGNYNHGVYISKKVEGDLEFRRNSVIGTSGQGHGLKTGAGRNVIEDNVIAQLDGDGSLCIDIVVGGHSEIRNNVCQVGPNRDNRNLLGIALSGHKTAYPKRQPDFTLIEGNTFIIDGDGTSRNCLLITETPGPIVVTGNKLVGPFEGCQGLSEPLGVRLDYLLGLPLAATRANNRLFADRQAAGLPAYPDLPSP
ncbi:MAG: right-handed parallel beta-helix repeat-containing protein [Pseudomonadota bacterium]